MTHHDNPVDAVMTAQFRKKTRTVNAVQWHRFGDHPAVGRLPASHRAWDMPAQAEHCGWVNGQFVHPGYWVIEDRDNGFLVLDPFTFTAEYEPDENQSQLPDIETVSAQVHEAWMESKRAQGVTSRPSEKGEELMVPYEQLSNEAQELDRGTVRAVYAAIEAASG